MSELNFGIFQILYLIFFLMMVFSSIILTKTFFALRKFDLKLVIKLEEKHIRHQTILDLVILLFLFLGGFFCYVGFFQKIWIGLALFNYLRFLYFYCFSEPYTFNPIYNFTVIVIEISALIGGGFFTA